jgi:biofilm PGA synthesis N-glycosyltransferase PgaC
MGGAQVLLKNVDALLHPEESFLWPLLIEMCASVVWSYAMVALTAIWLVQMVLPKGVLPVVGSPLGLQGSGLILGATCLLQFTFSMWLDRRHDRGLGRNLFWMIWYPIAFWVINCASTVAAYPTVLVRGRARARWISPDRGIRP